MTGSGRDVKGGIWIGLQFACAYSLIAFLILALGGTLGTVRGWNIFGRYLSVYVFSGVVGGAIYGVLRPLTNRQWGLMLVLSMVGLIIYPATMYTFLTLNGRKSEPGLWILTMVVAIVFGIGAGHKIWGQRSHRGSAK
jgi:hypothetical protein